jgi:hypothetical protein
MMGEPMKRRLEPAFARIERFIRDGEIDGGALAVAFEGEVVAEAYFGAAASVRDLLRLGLRFTKGNKRPILSDATIRTMVSDQSGGVISNLIGQGPDGPRPWGLGFAVRGSAPTLGRGNQTVDGYDDA